MRVLVTGHQGYVGSVLTPLLREAGHEVEGLDTGFYVGRNLGEPPEVPTRTGDVRDVQADALVGIEAVVHLAALSNDPLGDLNPDLTYDINHRASVRLAEVARDVGVERFVFASSCSLYGAAAGDDFLDEESPFNPVTPYAESKILSEQDVRRLASDDFSPTFMRNATAYGYSPMLRTDIMVNDLAAHAYTSGRILIKSDGTPWRPLVHVEDIGRAVVAILEAPRERIHNQAFNIGRAEDNHQVRDVASMVAAAVDGSEVTYAAGASGDARDYRVSFDKVTELLPEFRPQWTVRTGIQELLERYERHDLREGDYLDGRYTRLRAIADHLEADELSADLRWRSRESAATS